MTRIKIGKEIYHKMILMTLSEEEYECRNKYKVQKKVLFVWETIREFWDKRSAESFLKAYNELNK